MFKDQIHRILEKAPSKLIILCRHWFGPQQFRPRLDQFSKVFRIEYVPLYLDTFFKDTY